MVDFTVDIRYVQDLEDDFIINKSLNLYEFIDKDPVRAFYLGLHIKEWYDRLTIEQKYLYSKQIRHNKDDIEKYQKQVIYWGNKFKSLNNKESDLVTLFEYIFNNMFWNKDTEEIDQVKLAFLFGNMIADEKSKDIC